MLSKHLPTWLGGRAEPASLLTAQGWLARTALWETPRGKKLEALDSALFVYERLPDLHGLNAVVTALLAWRDSLIPGILAGKPEVKATLDELDATINALGVDVSAARTRLVAGVTPERVERTAIAALRYARAELAIGAANIPDRVAETGGWSEMAVGRIRQEGDWRKANGRWSYVREQARTNLGDGLGVASLMMIAAAATANRAGNCAEYAAVAFAYLRANPVGRRVCHCMTWKNRSPDHCLVTLSDDADGRMYGYKSWPAKTIIIDGWGGYVATKEQLDARSGAYLARADGVSDEHLRATQLTVADGNPSITATLIF